MPKFSIGPRTYRTKKAAEEAIRAIRDSYEVGATVDHVEDHALLRDLIDLHPDAGEKIGCGIEAFVIDRPMRGKHSGFKIVRTDGTEIDFSFLSCLTPPSHRQQVLAAMRGEVADTVNGYFTARAAANTLTSDMSGTPLDENDPHVSYFRGPSFLEIATLFIDKVGGWDTVELNSAAEAGYARFKDRELAQRWHEHLTEHAVFGLLTAQENLRRPH
ncbi:DCL family protein [Streptomyces sp. NPDC002308]